mgnify:CR=1 FL=1
MGKTEWIKKNPTTRFKKTRSHNPAKASTSYLFVQLPEKYCWFPSFSDPMYPGSLALSYL